MKKILAVSGGVDSMVLFDIYKKDPNVVVAHFNHGTRPSADADEKFVREKCAGANIECFVGRTKLGPNSSEEAARELRYKFLFDLRDKISSKAQDEVRIYTAHHLDDLVESVFINLLRGTGWRGLTPFSGNVFRPFLSGDVLLPESKADILVYAARHKISFREDPTNFSDKYMRNRIREKLLTLDPQTHYELNQKIKKLYFSQKEIRAGIDSIVNELIPKDGVFKREWFFNGSSDPIFDEVCSEILKAALSKKNIFLTRPQMENFLLAIRTYEPEKSFNLPKDKLIKIHKNYFKI